jgi:DNA-binding CsgD family transcriptional regulator
MAGRKGYGPSRRSIRVDSPHAKSTSCASRRGGLATRSIADRLNISPKTADHHIQHIYTKIGVSTPAAAALWAMQHDV